MPIGRLVRVLAGWSVLVAGRSSAAVSQIDWKLCSLGMAAVLLIPFIPPSLFLITLKSICGTALCQFDLCGPTFSLCLVSITPAVLTHYNWTFYSASTFIQVTRLLALTPKVPIIVKWLNRQNWINKSQTINGALAPVIISMSSH